jgi:methylase of polypeptide subunit release factors
VMQPLRREWKETREAIDNVLRIGKPQPTGREKPITRVRLNKAYRDANVQLRRFHERLATLKILDPACGSGNFLYVTLQRLKDLEKEILVYAGANQLGSFLPQVGPWQFYGIEINPYAFELAQTTLWIGYLQWIRTNGFGEPAEPILRALDNFKNMDAILDLSNPKKPREPDWPTADFIIGNPPFLGDKKMRRELGDEYVTALRRLYKGRVPGGADLVTYWFEKARRHIADAACYRAGLIATQGIRGGRNREVLARIKDSGDIFFAISDRDWILDGATVHVSLIGFDDGSERGHTLDGKVVEGIFSNLTAGDGRVSDVTQAVPLSENAGQCFLGVMKAGAFDINPSQALSMIHSPNPHGRPNSDVLRPRVTARDILQRAEVGWIIDFGCDAEEAESSAYELPWKYVEQYIKPDRLKNRRKRLATHWWIHGECRPGLRRSLAKLRRFIVTPEVSKHRIFVWLDAVFLADHQTRAFACDDDFSFGILHSRIHEVWALSQGTQLREKQSGFRYTPTTCFETYPFPICTRKQQNAIAAASKQLEELRSAWLYPSEWIREETLEFPASLVGSWGRYVRDPDERGIGIARYVRQIPKNEKAAEYLAKRTLTRLYNDRPTWLNLAHRRMDEAVFAAYGWEANLSDEEIQRRLLALNRERVAVNSSGAFKEKFPDVPRKGEKISGKRSGGKTIKRKAESAA